MKRGVEQAIFLMFALIVFLIVTVIVIQMFLKSSGGIERVGKYVNLEYAKKECASLSEKWPPIEYCKKVYAIDLNGDGSVGGVVENPITGISTCETAAFCYSIYDRPTGSECMVNLCKYFIDTKKLTPEEATKKVFGYYRDVSTSTVISGSIDDIAEQLGIVDNKKSEKNKGILFVGDSCRPDEVFKITWREVLKQIKENAWDTTACNDISITLDTDGILKVDTGCLNSRARLDIDSLYGGSAPNLVPLCAVLRSI